MDTLNPVIPVTAVVDPKEVIQKALVDGVKKEQLLVDISNKILQAQGSAAYTQPLVPGFENTTTSALLPMPTPEEYAEQVASGEEPGYQSNNLQTLEQKTDLKRTRALLRAVTKLAMAVSWEPARRDYLPSNTNPSDGVYSPRRERDNSEGVDTVWRGLNDRGQGSSTETPSAVNSSLTGIGGVAR